MTDSIMPMDKAEDTKYNDHEKEQSANDQDVKGQPWSIVSFHW